MKTALSRIITLSISSLALTIGAYAQTDEKCPTISVEGPPGLTYPGNVMTFTVKVGNDADFKGSYKWTVSTGIIEEGQGTAAVNIRIPADATAGSVTATIEFEGLPKGCSVTASETTAFAPVCVLPVKLDQFGRLSLNEEKARVMNVALELKQEPDTIALFIFNISKKETYSMVEARTARMNRTLAWAGIPKDRARFLYSEGDEYHVKIYLFPPTASFPDVETDLRKLRPKTH